MEDLFYFFKIKTVWNFGNSGFFITFIEINVRFLQYFREKHVHITINITRL